MKVNEKDWSTTTKRIARLETIIFQYRSIFSHAVPEGQQYWTMAGQCAQADGRPLIGCEPWQMVELGLITADQFYGVEIEREIYDLNVRAYPTLTWHHDDFYRAMVKADVAGYFRPAIVNADLIHTPETSIGFISRILAHLTDVGGDIMLVANLVLHARFYKTKYGNDVVRKLNEDSRFVRAFNDGEWSMHTAYYPYVSSGSRTRMGSLIFARTA